jgi:hypothetical protein
MSAMQLLSDLSECLADELARGIGSLAEPCRSRLESLLKVLSHSELADLKGGLTGWLSGMKPERMTKQYTLVRQLILDVEQIFSQEVRQ